MAGGYGQGSSDPLEQFADQIRQIWSALRDLQRPTGTSIASLVAQVQAALANINATVTAAIQANSYTRPQIDALVANPPGAVNVGGVLTANPGVVSTDVRSRVLTTGYAVQYVDGSGRMGTVPSALRFKQDVEPHAIDPQAIEAVQIVTFRYKAAVAELGDDAPWMVGVIADQVDTIPDLKPFVQHDDAGEISGVDYGQLVVPVIATVQSLMKRVADLESVAGGDTVDGGGGA
jgi:hypothetical protein